MTAAAWLLKLPERLVAKTCGNLAGTPTGLEEGLGDGFV